MNSSQTNTVSSASSSAATTAEARIYSSFYSTLLAEAEATTTSSMQISFIQQEGLQRQHGLIDSSSQPHASSASSSSSSLSTSTKKKTNSRSQGNLLLHEQKTKRKREEAKAIKTMTEEADIYALQCDINKLHTCCTQVVGGCFQKLFLDNKFVTQESPNEKMVIDYIKKQREEQLKMVQSERDFWLQSDVREAIHRSEEDHKGNTVFKYKCYLPDPTKVLVFGQDGRVNVCKNALGIVKNISQHEWKLVCKRFKETNRTYVPELRIRKFKDDEQMDISYNDAQSLILDNVVDAADGKRIKGIGMNDYQSRCRSYMHLI